MPAPPPTSSTRERDDTIVEGSTHDNRKKDKRWNDLQQQNNQKARRESMPLSLQQKMANKWRPHPTRTHKRLKTKGSDKSQSYTTRKAWIYLTSSRATRLFALDNPCTACSTCSARDMHRAQTKECYTAGLVHSQVHTSGKQVNNSSKFNICIYTYE